MSKRHRDTTSEAGQHSLTATTQVTQLIPQRRRMRVWGNIVNQRGETVLEGDGLIQKDDR